MPVLSSGKFSYARETNIPIEVGYQVGWSDRLVAYSVGKEEGSRRTLCIVYMSC